MQTSSLVQDHEIREYISTDFDEEEFYLFTYPSGNSTHLGGESDITYETVVWYEVKKTWATDGAHTARLVHPSNGEIASGTMSRLIPGSIKITLVLLLWWGAGHCLQHKKEVTIMFDSLTD